MAAATKKKPSTKAQVKSKKSLDNDDDVENSLESSKNERSDGHFLRLKEGKHALYFLSNDYAEGYVHWVSTPEGARRVVCSGGLDGKGWAADTCPICAEVANLFKKAKKHEDSHGKDNAVTNKLRKRARNFRAKYEAHFLAAAGTFIRVKQGTEKIWEPDFDDAKVGILSLSREQYENFTALRNSEQYPFMKGGADLTNRVIVYDKAKRDDSTFATVEFKPAKKPSDPPDVEYDESEFDLEEAFVIDEEEVEKMSIVITSPSVDDDADYEDEDDEETSSKSSKKKSSAKKSAKAAEDDFLNDDDEESEDDESDDEEDDSDDDFEDDDPEEETPAKVPAKKSTTAKKTSSKKGK